jgi:PhnB protein
MANPVPEGTHTLTPHLVVKDAAKAIQFYETALGAAELFRMDAPGGRIGHAELQLGDSRFYIADEFPGGSLLAPKQASVGLHVYVADCDALFRQAVAAGAKVVKPLTDMFWGDRYGQVRDPFGHVWSIATHKEDLSPDEMARRSDEAMAQMAAPAKSKPKPKAKPKAKSKKSRGK